MSAGRSGPGAEASASSIFADAFVDELGKIAVAKKRKKDEDKGGRLSKILRGAGIGSAVGAGAALGAHALEHHQHMRTFKSLAPLAKAFGPDAERLFAKLFKPRFVRPLMFKRALAGGLLGLAPGVVFAALT